MRSVYSNPAASAMRKDNVFQASNIVIGESFFGRSEELLELERLLCKGKNHRRGISVIGAHKIGKSSLINRFIERHLRRLDKTVIVNTTMQGISSACDFLHELSLRLGRAISEISAISNDNTLKSRQQALDEAWTQRVEHQSEPSQFKFYFESVLERLTELSWQTFLIIDEFDNAETLFQDSRYFGLVRDFSYQPQHGTTTILISRRQLHKIERLPNSRNSTFNGAFENFPIRGFSEDDMDDFWGGLSQYEIFKDTAPDLEEQLKHYAGTHPYLLCIYGKRMAQMAISETPLGQISVRKIRQFEGDTIDEYYKTVVVRLKEDEHFAKVMEVLSHSNAKMDDAETAFLEKTGYLQKLNGTYISFCQDFTEYLSDT